MLEPVNGEQVFSDRTYRQEMTPILESLWGWQCVNPWHKENTTGTEIHHVEPKGRIGAYHLISNCLPLCRDCHNLIHSAGLLRITRIAHDDCVVFVFEKLDRSHVIATTRKLAVKEYGERILQIDGKSWNLRK